MQVGAPVNCFAAAYITPLHVAVERGHLEVVKFTLKTSLRLLIANIFLIFQIAEILINKGATIEGRDWLGRRLSGLIA